jgi:hypothetical protein
MWTNKKSTSKHPSAFLMILHKRADMMTIEERGQGGDKNTRNIYTKRFVTTWSNMPEQKPAAFCKRKSCTRPHLIPAPTLRPPAPARLCRHGLSTSIRWVAAARAYTATTTTRLFVFFFSLFSFIVIVDISSAQHPEKRHARWLSWTRKSLLAFFRRAYISTHHASAIISGPEIARDEVYSVRCSGQKVRRE